MICQSHSERLCFWFTFQFHNLSNLLVLRFLMIFNTIIQEYLKTDPAGRDPDTPILKIRQGFEPPSFTGFFGVWDRDLWSVSDFIFNYYHNRPISY